MCIVAMLIFGAPPAALSASLQPAFDAHIRPYVDTNNFSGAVLVARGGKILFNGAATELNYAGFSGQRLAN
jgi:hypothetical protein